MRDYHTLYSLQDAVLHEVFSRPTTFYLTGGTCLHRYYLGMRYSDDLDLFTADTDFYRDEVLEVVRRLSDTFRSRTAVNSRDFMRVIVDDLVQVDFVCDRVARTGRPRVQAGGFRIDTIENIAANKVCALVGRDEPKDVFDLLALSCTNEIDLSEAISDAAERCVFDADSLVFRLSSFPIERLADLPLTPEANLDRLTAAMPHLKAALAGHP